MNSDDKPRMGTIKISSSAESKEVRELAPYKADALSFALASAAKAMLFIASR